MTDNESAELDSTDVECPACSDTFDTERAMSIHHKMAHGESLAMVDRECKQCGAGFETRQCWADRGEGQFCSTDCKGEWQSENKSGEDHPSWKGGPVAVDCAWCGSEIERRQSLAERSENHFCSDECDAKYKSEHRTGEWSNLWNGGPAVCECEECGEKYTVQRTAEDRSRFCSLECKAKWESENWVGENHPGTWKGGAAPYGPGWNQEKKETVRERDGYKCQDCGMEQDEHLERHGEKLHVHHIQKARSFDDPAERNDESNLITLCRSCHLGKWEQMPGLRPMKAD